MASCWARMASRRSGGAKWARTHSGAALNVARHRDVGIRSCRPSVRARFAGSRAERVGARRGGNVCDVITCSGFAHPHPHARRGPTICEMYIDDRSSAIYINVRYDVRTNVRLHASGYPSTLQLSLRTSSYASLRCVPDGRNHDGEETNLAALAIASAPSDSARSLHFTVRAGTHSTSGPAGRT